MKICMITNAFSLEKLVPPQKIGGAEVCVERISRYLVKRGHKIVIITQSPYTGLRSLWPRQEFKEGIKIYSFYPINIFSIYHTHNKSLVSKGLWRIIDLINPVPVIFIRNILLKERPDIIHNHILHGFSPLFLLTTIKKLKIPILQSLHSYGFFCLRCDLFRHSGEICKEMPFFCKIFRRLSVFLIGNLPVTVISPSQFCLDIYTKNGFFPQSRKIILYNGVETYPLNPHQKTPFLDDRLNILYAGRMVKTKGVHILIEAFKQLKYENIRLHIVGEGFFEGTLKKMAGNDKRIIFLGKIPSVELQELYKISGVTVVPSLYYEILGNVVLESMASGTAVVASCIGGINELIQNGYNGYLFKPGDSDELKEILARLIENPRQLRAMGENAFQFAKRFNIRDHVDELEKIYVEAKNKPRD